MEKQPESPLRRAFLLEKDARPAGRQGAEADRALARLGGYLSASVRNWAELRRSYLLLRPRPFGFSPSVRPRPICLANRERAAA